MTVRCLVSSRLIDEGPGCITGLTCLPAGHEDSILEALSFPEEEEPPGGPAAGADPGPGAQALLCPLCPQTSPLSEAERLLKHLLLEHKLVVADVKLIADLPRWDHPTV